MPAPTIKDHILRIVRERARYADKILSPHAKAETYYRYLNAEVLQVLSTTLPLDDETRKPANTLRSRIDQAIEHMFRDGALVVRRDTYRKRDVVVPPRFGPLPMAKAPIEDDDLL